MISKDRYIECLRSIKAYREYENKLADLDLNLWERDEVQNMVVNFIDLLGYCTKDLPDTESYSPSDLEYFIYDCSWGEENNLASITSPDDKRTKLKSTEELWNYLVNKNPEIEDKNEF